MVALAKSGSAGARALADAQLGAFMRDARATDADLVVTPEYSMPWSTLTAALQAAITPSRGKLWAIGCESIRYNELQQLKENLAPADRQSAAG